MSAACYHFLLRTVFTGSTPPDWPEKDTHRIASEKMSDGHVKIEWEDKLGNTIKCHCLDNVTCLIFHKTHFTQENTFSSDWSQVSCRQHLGLQPTT
jgi:hypothetical protein